jgi:glycosyltransferase involved in cell wall biosynthesis
VEREKGIYEALDAYRILKQHCPHVSLTIAGQGSELEPAIQYACARRLEGISFVGHVEGTAKREAFKSADVYLYLLPSHSEGLPISVLEAMASGLPIVASAVGGLPDFFQNGKMGFLTESRDPKVLASLLGMLAGDACLRTRMGLFNQTYANRFRAPRIASRLERLYALVLEGAH